MEEFPRESPHKSNACRTSFRTSVLITRAQEQGGRSRATRAAAPRHAYSRNGQTPPLALRTQRARTQPPRSHCAPPARRTPRESQRTRTAASTAATGQQHAHARRTASRTHRARSPRDAASSVREFESANSTMSREHWQLHNAVRIALPATSPMWRV